MENLHLTCLLEWYIFLLSPNNTCIGGASNCFSFNWLTIVTLMEEMLLPESSRTSWMLFSICRNVEQIRRLEEAEACIWGWCSSPTSSTTRFPGAVQVMLHQLIWHVSFAVAGNSWIFCNISWRVHNYCRKNTLGVLENLSGEVCDEPTIAYSGCQCPLASSRHRHSGLG